ncbi:MAG: DsrE family protein, partial [Alphaproteobacteria bacterium]
MERDAKRQRHGIDAAAVPEKVRPGRRLGFVRVVRVGCHDLSCAPMHPIGMLLGILRFLVGRTAVAEGHAVSLFLADDGVQLMRDAVLDNLAALGTGRLREHFDAIAAGGAKFYVSGMSSKGRGLSPDELEGKSAQMAMPDVLLQLTLGADTTLTYYTRPINWRPTMTKSIRCTD